MRDKDSDLMEKAALSLMRGVCLFLMTAFLMNAQAQAHETPEALAQAYVEAKNASDLEQLRALLHPEYLSFLLEQDPGALKPLLIRWAQGEAPAAHEIELIDITHLPAYHAKTQRLIMGSGQAVYYPVAPELLMQFWVISLEGERLAGESLTIGSKEGHWYILFADVKPPAVPQEPLLPEKPAEVPGPEEPPL